jgi:hypothetical protein
VNVATGNKKLLGDYNRVSYKWWQSTALRNHCNRKANGMETRQKERAREGNGTQKEKNTEGWISYLCFNAT